MIKNFTIIKYDNAIISQTQSAWASATRETENGTIAIGDMSKTIMNPANQLRILQSRLQSIGRYWGLAFMPIATVVIPLLNSLAKIMIGVGQAFASFMARLFGVGDSWKDIVGEFGSVGGGADFSGMADTLEDSSNSAGGVASGLDKASKSAKEVKKQLMGIDEINNLTLPDDTSSGGSGGGGAGGAGGFTPNLEWDNLITTPDPEPMVDKLTTKIEKAFSDIFKPLVDSYNKYMPSIFENMKDGFENIGHIGASAFDIINENWGAWFGSVTNLVFSLLDTFSMVFDGITIILRGAWDNGGAYLFQQLGDFGASIMNLGTTINDYIVKPFLSTFNDTMAPVIGNFISDVLERLGDEIKDISDYFNQISEDIKIVFGDGSKDTEAFKQSLARLKTTLYEIIGVAGGLYVAFNFKSILNGFKSIFSGKIAGSINTFFAGIQDGYGVMGTLKTMVFGNSTAFQSLKLSLSAIATPASAIIIGLTAIAGAFAYVYSTNEDFRKSVNELVGSVFNNLKKGIQNIIKVLGSLADGLSKTLGIVFDFLKDSGVIDVLAKIGLYIGNVFNILLSLFSNVLLPLVNLIVDIFFPIFNTILGAITSTLSPALNFLSGILNFILDIFNEWATFLSGTLYPLIGDLIDWIDEILSSVEDLWDGIMSVLGVIFDWVMDNIINPIIEGFKTFVSTIINSVVSCVSGIMSAFGVIASWFYNNVIQPLLSFFGSMWSNIKTWAGDAWNGIKSVFSGAWSWFQNSVLNPIANVFANVWNSIKRTVSNAWNGILSLFSSGGRIFSGVVDGVANVFKSIVNTIIKGINKVIAVPFKTINGLLNGLRNTDILGIKPFKGLWSKNPLPIPKIPRLAQGGIAYGDTIVEVAEYAGAKNNPEVISPLSELNGMMSNTIKQVLREENQNNSGNGSGNAQNNSEDRIVNANIYMNGRKFYQEMVREDRKERRNSGKSPLGSGV